MSELDELLESVTTAMAMANDSMLHTSNADELCSRVIASGMHTGFGNDPMFIIAAQEKITNARGVLSVAAADLETAQTHIRQAQQS